MNNSSINIKKINLLLSLFIILLISIIAYFFYDLFSSYLVNFISLITPFVIGGAIAYLCNPICDFLERKTLLPRGLLSIIIITSIILILLIII